MMKLKILEVEYLGNINDRVSGDWEIIDGDTNYNITIYGPQIDGELSGFQLAFNEGLDEFIIWYNEVYGVTDGSLDGLREYINNLGVEWEPGADFQFDNSGL
ncbi:hypothetical protein [Oceanobacillus jeddahense]|uniref:Uncharacterized protein n=1 Tax=Oceanobacillus jeddahense TaxID=1462527 RepID=A0ABY5JRJ0_9BACI|nr:hypothetical protein [Oceanobacillus jeddahense]UUI02849.1 hypothetical protein NP439_22915 [Oceanobacillus jeddahense]